MHPAPPIGAIFCLPIETEKAIFHSHILRIYRKLKRKIRHFRLFFTIFFCHKSIFFVLVRIFYNKNIQKRKKTGHKSPRKPNERLFFHILPFIKKNKEKSAQKARAKANAPPDARVGLSAEKRPHFQKTRKNEQKASKKRTKREKYNTNKVKLGRKQRVNEDRKGINRAQKRKNAALILDFCSVGSHFPHFRSFFSLFRLRRIPNPRSF